MSPGRNPENPILLVDDEQSVIDILSLRLRSNGIDNVVACTDSREAMSILRGGEIELVLLDLTMPHLPGEKLLAAIHEEMPQVPVIVVTGTPEADAEAKVKAFGAAQFIKKPTTPDDVAAAIEAAVAATRPA